MCNPFAPKSLVEAQGLRYKLLLKHQFQESTKTMLRKFFLGLLSLLSISLLAFGVMRLAMADSSITYRGDFNGDGKPDYLQIKYRLSDRNATSGSSGFVYISNDSGGYTKYAGLNFANELYTDTTNVIVGDFNGDGKSDFIRQEKGMWANDNLYMSQVYLSNGDGAFRRIELFPGSNWLHGDLTNISVGDFNGDGKSDFIRQEKGVWANDNLYMSQVYLSNGDGTFRQFDLYPRLNWLHGGLTNIIVGDFDGDGKSDFIRQEKDYWANDQLNMAQVHFSNGDGTFRKVELPESIYWLNGNYVTLIAGDINGDGKTDLLRQERGAWAKDSHWTAQALLSIGDGTFAQVELPDQNAMSGDVYRLRLMDFNGDGRFDVVKEKITRNINDPYYEVYTTQYSPKVGSLGSEGAKNSSLYDPFAYTWKKSINDGTSYFINPFEIDEDGDSLTKRICSSSGSGESVICVSIPLKAPWPSDPKEDRAKVQDCSTIGRTPRQLTNALPKYLPIYPNPEEKIQRFYVEWTNQSVMIDGDDLRRYMIMKLQKDFPFYQLTRYIDHLGGNGNRSAWEVQLLAPMSMRDFSRAVQLAFLNDSTPFYTSDPMEDFKRKTNCQYDAIEPIRVLEPAAMKPNKINGYINSSLYSSMENGDISLAENLTDKTSRYPAVNYAAPDILMMHKIYSENIKNWTKTKSTELANVNIAVIDMGAVSPLVTNGPSFDVASILNPEYVAGMKFSHAMLVAFQLGGKAFYEGDKIFENSEYTIGAIPRSAMDGQLVAFDMYTTKYNADESIFSLLGKDFKELIFPNTLAALIYYISGGVYPIEPGCKTNYSCFMSHGVPVKNTIATSTNIISTSLAYLIDTNELLKISNEEINKNFACGGPISQDFLNGRYYKIPVIQAAGNSPNQLAAMGIACQDHVIGVVGTVVRQISQDTSRALVTVDINSGAPLRDLPGNYVGAPFSYWLYEREQPSDFRKIDGTSYATPLVAGIFATALTLAPNNQKFDAKKLTQFTVDSVNQKLYLTNDFHHRSNDYEENNIQMATTRAPINAACFLQYFAKLNKYPIINTYNPINNSLNICNFGP